MRLSRALQTKSGESKSGARVTVARKHQVQLVKPIEFEDGAVQIDASIVAEGLGLALPRFRQEMRAGRITSLSERGIDADAGRHRLTFFSEHRRFRVVVDAAGTILQRSALDFGDASLPKSVRKPGG
jgi:hypothetical protein